MNTLTKMFIGAEIPRSPEDYDGVGHLITVNTAGPAVVAKAREKFKKAKAVPGFSNLFCAYLSHSYEHDKKRILVEKVSALCDAGKADAIAKLLDADFSVLLTFDAKE